MSLIAAVDLGTTTARAGLFDEEGTRLTSARRKIITSHPFPGAVEQDPTELVSIVVELLGVVLAEAGMAAADVAALGIANQRSTVVAWDARSGEPLTPAIGWQDTRTADRVAEFVAQGIPLTTSASCSKLEWLMTNDEAVADAAARSTLRLGTVDSWLMWSLSDGAVHATDPSNAGATGLLDLQTGMWSDGALAVFGIPHEPMPTIVASDELVGTTTADVLGAEIPLTARIGDQQAACVAHDVGPGSAKLTVGTSAMLDVGTGTTPADAPAGTYALPMWRRAIDGAHVDEFMVEASAQTAGAAVEWLVSMGLLEAVDQLDAVCADAASDDGTGPVFVPALAGLGSPQQDPTARALLGGVGLDTRPADVVRAVVDGIASRVADLVDTVPVDGTLPVDGGLSRSDAVLGAIADITGLTICPADDPETTLRGAAMLAASSPSVELEDLPPVDYKAEIGPRIDDDARTARRGRWHTAVGAARSLGDTT